MVDVGGIINRLTPLIEKKVRNEYNLWINSETEARKLCNNLGEIRKVLEEAERRRLADSRVKDWLKNPQDVIYDIDDVLDEWETLDHQLHIKGSDDDGDGYRTWMKKIGIFIESLCSRPTQVPRRRDVALKIQKLNSKVVSLAEEKGKYTLLPIKSDSQDVKYEITTSFSDLIELSGQQTKKDELVDQLLTGEGEEPGVIQVITLVGMIGVGKTALAQLAFNDPRVQASFELKSWICVSHISDIFRLTKAILQSFRVSYPKNAELQMLLELIQQSVSGRKLFLVLDHVRIEDESMWNQLKVSLRQGAPESRIVVTSRNENVRNLMGSTRMIEVQPLNKDDCWFLFSGIALCGRSERNKEKLEPIGRRIARKCDGLPLFAKTLGYYLQSRYSEKNWEDVLEKEVWQLEEVAKALFATLEFSYNELPLALKHCFSFSATFDKGIEIDVDDLIKLWQVQGYIETDLQGWDYFEKLTRSSFFHKCINSGEIFQTCKVSGILHAFARYLTMTRNKVYKHRNVYSDKPLTRVELGSLKSVRFLTLTCKEIQVLPMEINQLIHLRHLVLSLAQIRQLPEAICDLFHLQLLGFLECNQLSELPNRIGRLRNLRHLVISDTGLRGLPQGLGELTNLQTLSELYVGREANEFGYLAKLNQLENPVEIKIIGDLNEERDVEDAKKADLGNKNRLSDLTLSFEGEVSMDVMEALHVPPKLQNLCMCGYKGDRFPNWMITSLDNLRVLEFNECNKCLELPPLGRLPFLESFRIENMKSLKRVGNEFLETSDCVIFPNLRKLEFLGCDSWEEWEDITDDRASSHFIMPCLEELTLSECIKLKALPHLLLKNAISLEPENLHIDEGCSLLLKRYQPDLEGWKSIFENRQ